MRNLYRFLSLLAVFVVSLDAALAQTQSPQENVIHIQIRGMRNSSGQVVCALYSSPDGFPKKSDKALAHVNSAIGDKQAVCEFSGITPGTYAVSVFHDENSNGKLDSNFMGI